VERDKPKKSESVGQTLPQLPWKQKSGIKNIFGFLSIFNKCVIPDFEKGR
jgi:hypothetical protein